MKYKCRLCKEDMRTSLGCKVKHVYCNGKKYTRIIVSEPLCYDCNAKMGACHHMGCDQESCPACGAQLSSCNCKDVHFRIEE